jgi:autotransporter-associated beta strand protein
MNKSIRAVTRCSLMLLLPTVVYGISAQWDLDPTSGDWNMAANWTPMGIPNGPADIATFALSHNTDVSISANTEVNSIIFTPAATNPYTITANPGFTLTISGVGIVNNSGTTQNFVTEVSGFSLGRISFTNNATAGISTRFTNNGSAVFNQNYVGGVTDFLGSASAAYGTFTNNGGTNFGAGGGVTAFSFSATAANGTFINNGGTASFAGGGFTNFELTATAANGSFINNGGTVSFAGGGSTRFNSVSSAANGTFINNASTVSGASGGETTFRIFSSAGSAIIFNNGATVNDAGGGITEFFDSSTAANATITSNGATVSGALGGKTIFYETSTADSATLIANSGTGGGEGGQIFFNERSTGGTSRVELFGNGSLDISAHAAPGVTIGSIEGDGTALLGANNLTVGSNNLSTNFSGVIQDGGQNGGTGGSLTKIGSGTLALTGANTYTGNTNVNGGVLQVDGSINSNTLVQSR